MSDKRQRIKQITEELQKLTSELELLLRLEEEPRGTIDKGSRVRITNSYKGLQHSTGTVTKVTETQVVIRLDNGDTVRRAHFNVVLIE